QATHEVIHPTAQDVWTLFHSYAFDFSVWEFWGALRYGGQLVVIPSAISRAPDAFHQLLSTYQVTILNQTPSAFRQLSEHMQALGHSKPPALRLIIFGGEAVEVASLRLWMSQYGDIQPRLLNMYGITETTVHVTHHQVTSEEVADTRGGLIGTPLPDLQVYLLDAHDQLVPQGVSGELHIGGGGLARGYLNRPALTAARFRPNPFTTKVGQRLYQSGDVGRYGEAGQLHYLGRNDGQVKLRGFRIELGEIEAALRHQPTIKETLVLCREDRPGDKHLVAYVVPTPNVSLDATTLRTTLKTLLPEYMVPTVFMLLDVLPLTPNGKVDHKALPIPKATDRSHEKTYVAPQTPTEKTLVKIWQTVLNVSQIGVQDNFFELGGHSLLATQVVSRVGALTHKTVSVRTIFDCPTIAQLASNLEDLQSQQDGDLAPPLRPQDQKGLIPLSFSQQRLWFLDQWQPNSALYNVSSVFRLRGLLRVDALRNALRTLIGRHESLRTIFHVVDGMPRQHIQRLEELPSPCLTIMEMPNEAGETREAMLQRFIIKETHKPFDLTQGPLFRAILLPVDETETVFIVTLHHIITDGWSMEILLKELAVLYAAEITGTPANLPALPIQYVDYAVWQRDWLQGDVLTKQLTYWRTELTDAPPSIELSTDFPRPAELSYRGERISFTLPPLLTRSLKKLSQREGATMFMILLAAFQVLLFRYTGQRDILFGTPLAGRTHREMEGLIGFFVNTLVIRTQLKDQLPFQNVLQQVKTTCLNAFAHQDVPFEKLVEILQPTRDPSRHPLFQVMFQLQHGDSTSELTLQNLEVHSLPQVGQTAKFDIALGLLVKGEILEGTVTFNTDLFESATIKRLTMHYHRLLEGLVANPTHVVSQVPLLTKAERHQLLIEWNPPVSQDSPALYVHQLFETQAAHSPDTVAIVFEDEHLTYEALNNEVSRLANYLAKQGIGPEVRVAFCLERSINLLIAPLGILKAGAVYVPLDPSTPVDRMAFILTEAQICLGLTQLSLLNKFNTQKSSENVEPLL
ncbi:MAG: non-ribosomal peptide synthetase, partial [Nitrospirales bacterium]